MKITGVTIIKNAVKNFYPVLESIGSVLPVVDEMIVSIGDSEDETEALIKSIDSPKIKIVYSTWDMDIRKGGSVLAVETNKALEHIDADTDWIFYIQADEVVHEKYHANIRRAAEFFLHNKKVEGLLFRYVHFYGTYDYIIESRRFYNYETRIIRNNKNIRSYKDAQGFRKGEEKLDVALIDAYVYHYGWVKSPGEMKQKQKNVSRFWEENDDALAKVLASEGDFEFDDFEALEKFSGTHPAIMQKRIEQQNWILELDTSRKNFTLKDRILIAIEKITGKRLFSFSNHRIVAKM